MTFLLFILLFVISNISAFCNETQVDINNATLEELQEITQIGPSRAQQIISLRSFSSVDDLARVSGIGNGTRLNQIKTQGLACVNEEAPENQEQENSTTEVNESIIPTIDDEPLEEYFPKNFTMPKITMNSQSIKTIENEQKNSKINFAVYGLAGFCFLLATLFAIKKFRKNKNEFRK
jgi:competence ComEA-like helix-hairpin-helix protein